MGKIQDRRLVVETIIRAAKIYKEQMVGNAYLYVFENRFIEVVYRVKDFLHLTGVGTKLSAKDFYKEATRGTLKENQIFFTKRHPYDLCLKKMSQLENISAVTDSELLILEDMSTDTLVYKFGLTELNFTVGMSYDYDDAGLKKSNMFIARSLRVEDSFQRCAGGYEVDFILKKKNNQPYYNEVTYADSRKNIEILPDEILSLISKELLEPTNNGDINQ